LRTPKAFRIARLWPWIEKTPARRFLFAAVLGVIAAALHWMIFPWTQGRITFLFYIPAIVLATTLAGRWPGALVAVVGLVNAVAMKSPGTLLVPNSADQVALISAALVSLLVILVGDFYRSTSRRELSDLHDLHELSATLASIPRLPDQLQLILATFVRMHGAQKGLISIYDFARDRLVVAASQGFSPQVVEALRELKAGEGASGIAYLNRDRVVTMVGDGVNDAPALAQADVGIAIGAGTDVAIASAGVILASDDPRSVLSVIQLSRAGYRKMKQNLWWAAGYNLISVPLAAGVLAPIGFVLPMEVGALLMSLSTVVVALNAQLLRRLDLRPEAGATAASTGQVVREGARQTQPTHR
jgi:hypothetical protein